TRSKRVWSSDVCSYDLTEVIKGKFKRKINIINNKNFVFNNWLFIISIVLIVVGLGLDYFERKNEPVNDEIISLADLGYPGDQKKDRKSVVKEDSVRQRG